VNIWPRSPATGVALILTALVLQIMAIWRYVPLNGLYRWSEVPLRAGCRVERSAIAAQTTVFVGKEFTVKASVRNPATNASCDIDARITYDDQVFLSPDDRHVQVSLAPGQTYLVEWRLSAKKSGTPILFVDINQARRPFSLIAKSQAIEFPDLAPWLPLPLWFLGTRWTLAWWQEQRRERKAREQPRIVLKK
jgi:hypothetical protein